MPLAKSLLQITVMRAINPSSFKTLNINPGLIFVARNENRGRGEEPISTLPAGVCCFHLPGAQMQPSVADGDGEGAAHQGGLDMCCPPGEYNRGLSQAKVPTPLKHE